MVTLLVFLNYLKFLFSLIFIINIHKNKKGVIIFLSFFVFEEKDHGTMSVMTPCVIYFNIMGFMQSQLNELQLLSFFKNYLLIFYPFLLLDKMLIPNQW